MKAISLRAALGAISGALFLGVVLSAQRATEEKLDGYAEYRKGDLLIIEGQRTRATARTKFKGQRSLQAIPLGYRVEARGVRQADGVILLSEIDSKENDMAMFEKEVREGSSQLEASWLSAGAAVESNDAGGERRIGRIVDSGPQAARVTRITRRLLPSYVDGGAVRPRVIDNRDWNAMAMGNGAVWVFSGLLTDMSDDEVAIVLGHELAHYTHEHSRRGFRSAMWTQLALVGVVAATEAIDSRRARDVSRLGGMFALLATKNGYGRGMEDQADRVGMRYAYEAGFDVRRGPQLWRRFAQKYGDQNRVANFFFGNHSQASARERNLNRELALNYSP